ncbi:alpha glucosidase II, alpha subunit [Nadsonia fulvescens var. elongata DSM 6958]|uniref:Glucosidase II subunit alpha n=1 Tax=Nadsonia fulvescens var. elongata DSM 6958 TaxID=857566 RepID=A0A1E3PJD4_9ASCO|nr:alpha glucosidase II, alpha subunit [Nadsonia fulvescens var. elongata DSM 6958]
MVTISTHSSWLSSAIALLCLFPILVKAVDKSVFKSCAESSFCKRNRHYADAIDRSQFWASPYEVQTSSLKYDIWTGKLEGNLIKNLPNGVQEQIIFPFELSFLVSGNARLKIDEERRMKQNISIPGFGNLNKQRYNQAAEWALASGAAQSMGENVTVHGLEDIQNGFAQTFEITYGPGGSKSVVMSMNPFKMDFRNQGESQVLLNSDGLINLEHWRPQPANDQLFDFQLNEMELNHDMWADQFKGFKDTKPRGPESIALDITFSGYSHVYGIPEHSDTLSLRQTRGGYGNHDEPYRLYNVDIFEYEPNSALPMYGAIPFMQAHKQESSAGVFWINAADTYIDIIKTAASNEDSFDITSASTRTHWMSEAGIIDLVVMMGDTPGSINKLYGDLTGFTTLPQLSAASYHQCRWNYNTQDDVLEVDENFDLNDIPYDVIWLDIEYTKDRSYFTWDPATFPNPELMMQKLDESKRKLTAIIDPHLKASSRVGSEIKAQGLAIHDKDRNPFLGQCWPGDSYWIDTTNVDARNYWANQYALGSEFAGNSTNLFIWNDMNEPSVFHGVETTINRDSIHIDGWENRDLHNLYGMSVVNGTYEGFIARDANSRPFILTRSFFAGSQRFGAAWTGDNVATWESLQIATPMLLTNGVAGMPFMGADVGGFFKNPTSELLARWYQSGTFYPFFRAHAHIDTKRREPFLVAEPYKSVIRDAIKLRYALLPSIYTAFYHASVDGSPIMMPVYYYTPKNERSFAIDDQFFVGNTGILAKPVVQQDVDSVEIYIPDDEVYYDYFNYHCYEGMGYHSLKVELDTIPLLSRGGHIYARRDRFRRSSELMKFDPFTLIVTLSKSGFAKGDLYIDDGNSFDHQSGDFIHYEFTFNSGFKKLMAVNQNKSNPDTHKFIDGMANVTIEKIIIVGDLTPTRSDSQVRVSQNTESWDASIVNKSLTSSAHVLVIKKPNVTIGTDWEIQV